jgi:hypothetical protein
MHRLLSFVNRVVFYVKFDYFVRVTGKFLCTRCFQLIYFFSQMVLLIQHFPIRSLLLFFHDVRGNQILGLYVISGCP